MLFGYDACMAQRTMKISVNDATPQPDGRIDLARGVESSMRLWRDERPGADKPAASRPYETVGYVLAGRAELHIEGDIVPLAAGDSWTVPRGASHTYRIIETFSAVEATTPPQSGA